MDWKRAMEEERAALMRIVTLLCALAGLAERAASCSPAMRGFVLWVLSRAEAVARDFVVAGPDTRLASMPQLGCRPADAMRLAASLRALARQLKRQIDRQARLMPGVCGERDGDEVRTQSPLFGAMRAMQLANALPMLTIFAWPHPHPPPDTS